MSGASIRPLKRRYRIGTSGWQYDGWRGRFYPAGLAKRGWFDFYARHMSCVELNNSFYRQPDDSTWDRWCDNAPPGFRFAVKANRYITHMKRFTDCDLPLERFLSGAERLKAYLGPILFQAPPDFDCGLGNRKRLEAFLELLPGRLHHVFEFRHASWFGREGLSLLERHNVGFCVQDMPGLKCPVTATAPWAYFRFHGVGRTYGGSYPDAALRRWARRMRDLEGVEEVWAFFNNDADGFAPANAQSLARLLAGPAD